MAINFLRQTKKNREKDTKRTIYINISMIVKETTKKADQKSTNL